MPTGTSRAGAVASALRVILLPAVAALVLGSAGAKADDRGRVTVIEENDSIAGPTDKHYTQGLRISYLSAPVEPGAAFDRMFDGLGDALFPADSGARRHTDWAIGQSIFTPTDLKRRFPDPADRPYGAWLYGSAGLIQDTDSRRLDVLEVQLGMVGPAALGRQAQNRWHQYVIHVDTALGWSSQLHNEPGLVASYGRKWRLAGNFTGSAWDADVVPSAGATLGNVFTYAEGGAMLRLGYNLGSDYGPPRIAPGQSGTDYVNAHPAGGDLGAYVFVGGEGRLVARNIFLDGSSFGPSPSVDKRMAVGDLSFGASVLWGPYVRGSFAYVVRSEEFIGQRGADHFPSVGLSVHLDW
ncbi:MAG TPA: lipid A deacylase LpxR family protein [Candidatus Cybelea sp.]|nr:lipid A deacylase LpxR family protein [Candidatus Cybelea sp.]